MLVWGAHRNRWVWDLETAVLANTTGVEGLTKHMLLSLMWASLGFLLYRSINGREPKFPGALPVDHSSCRKTHLTAVILAWCPAWALQSGVEGSGWRQVLEGPSDTSTDVGECGVLFSCVLWWVFFLFLSPSFFSSWFRLSLQVLPGSFLP